MSSGTHDLTLPELAEGAALISWVAENILPCVQKPVRYIGDEPGTVSSNGTSSGDVLFMFPDVYEIGVGNIGMSLLRDTINASHDLVAESVYCPWPDMEERMYRAHVPLYSLESYRRASSFDIIGITVQHELCYTNILTMLSLSGIPLKQEDRSPSTPFIIGGGPGAFNPEPIADYFDLIFLGEGEDIIGDLVRMLSKGRRDGIPRHEVLKESLTFEGVYIPSFYSASPTRSNKGTIVVPRIHGAPERIRIHRNAHFPDSHGERAPRISLTAPTHDRLSVEIMRGCPGGCTFCQAKRFYGAMRTKCIDTVLDEIANGVAESGFDDVSLLGLSCSDYPGIHELLFRANHYLLPRNASLSLPSLRADSFSKEICQQLGRFRKSGFTFAPEAGSDLLRSRLGKKITNDEILSAIDIVLSHGGTGVKLYFMLGIPGESDEDIQAIIDLCRKALKLVKIRRARRLTVSIAPLVPKPYTPLERAAFEDVGVLESKRRTIADAFRSSRVHVRWRSEEYSRLEAILSRGDRRLSPVIMKAWISGARFDGWENELKIELWESAFRSKNLDWQEYLRAYPAEEEVPWSHISANIHTNVARSAKECESVVRESSRFRTENTDQTRDNETPGRLRIRYSKRGLYRFLSHLDLMRLWSRLLRKSSLNIMYTSGFSPRPRLSFGPALPVGFESTGEYLDVWLTSLNTTAIDTRLTEIIPDGLKPISIRSIPVTAPSLGSILRYATYSVRIPESVYSKSPGSGYYLPTGLVVHEIHENQIVFSIPLNTSNVPKPREFVQTLYGIEENDIPLVHFTRTGLLTDDDIDFPTELPVVESER